MFSYVYAKDVFSQRCPLSTDHSNEMAGGDNKTTPHPRHSFL